MLFAVSASHAQVTPETCKNSYTQQQEVDLGDKVVREVYRTQPVLPDSAPVSQYIRQLGARLVAAAPTTPGLTQQWPFNFHVVATDEINAFALPGGTMFVNLGAIQAAQTEAQLAGVMSHEMSHVILRHSTCNLIKQRHRSLLYGLGAIGAAAVGGDIAAQGVGALQGLDFLKMSRGDEKQADMLGVQILHDTGFDPRGLPQFFEIIIAKYGQGGHQFLSDHPNPGNRTEYLNAEIATLPPLPRPIVSTPAFTAAHTQAESVHALTATEIKTGAWRSSGQYATTPGGVAAASYSPATVAAGEAAMRDSAPGAAAPLTAAQLGLRDRLTRVQAAQFSIAYPASWSRSSAANAAASGAGSLTLAPPGGAGDFGLAYGAMLGVQAQSGNGVSDPATLAQASDTYAAQLAQTHSLTGDGAATTLTVAGQPATARYLHGNSPVAGQAERDWLVTVARPDGDLDTLIFVAPANQFSLLQPVFANMLASFHPQ